MCGEVPDPARAEIDLARLGLRQGDELGEVFGRERRVCLPSHWRATWCRQSAWSRARSRTGYVLIERVVDGVVGRDEADGVAIGRRRQNVLHADIAAGADVVLDHDRLAELLRQILAEEARDGIVGSAGGERNDEAHRPRRIIERIAGAGDEQRQQQRDQARATLEASSIMTFPLRSRRTGTEFQPTVFSSPLWYRDRTPRAALAPKMLRLAVSLRNGRS